MIRSEPLRFIPKYLGESLPPWKDCLFPTGASKQVGREEDCCSGLRRCLLRDTAPTHLSVLLRLRTSMLQRPSSADWEASWPCRSLPYPVDVGKGTSSIRKAILSVSFKWMSRQANRHLLRSCREVHPWHLGSHGLLRLRRWAVL